MNLLTKILDALMFRSGSEQDNETNYPIVTTGSIVWGVILRTAIIIIVSSWIFDIPQFRKYWWFLLFAIWFLVAFPAFRQYQLFNNRMSKFKEETLCGSCKHFESSSQLCRIYDEHVSKNYLPCDGQSWEPKSFEDS